MASVTGGGNTQRNVDLLIAEAYGSASGAIATAPAEADLLTHAMRRIHGGEWRTQVDHQCAFAFVVRIQDQGDATPRCEVP